MSPVAFTLFDTAIGACAMAWTGAGLAGVWLPEADPGATRARVRRRFPAAVEAAPTPLVAEAVVGMTGLLRGHPADLSGVALDMSGVPTFEREVYAALRAVPPGQVLTYGDLAARIRQPGAAQAVGRAMGRNPWPVVVPCHRVVAAGGRLHGFSAPGGLATKRRLLEIEGARLGDAPDLFAVAAISQASPSSPTSA